jgi:hypothetical protein
VKIFVVGNCHVYKWTIVCRDESRSKPQDGLAAVDWELFDSASGVSQEKLPGTPGGRISFTGLAAGVYEVTQSVSAQDGSTRQRTYGPFDVVR